WWARSAGPWKGREQRAESREPEDAAPATPIATRAGKARANKKAPGGCRAPRGLVVVQDRSASLRGGLDRVLGQGLEGGRLFLLQGDVRRLAGDLDVQDPLQLHGHFRGLDPALLGAELDLAAAAVLLARQGGLDDLEGQGLLVLGVGPRRV